MLSLLDKTKFSAIGHVLIKDTETGEVLVDEHNDIHAGNLSIALARGLSGAAHGNIFKIKFGNQGTYVDSTLTIKFRTPNVTGVTANLYNPTYVEIVDGANPAVGSGNSVAFTQVPLSSAVRIIITAIISPNEAVNRTSDVADASTVNGLDGLSQNATQGTFFFDELGLFTQGTGSPSLLNETDELMLSHLIFSPIEHTGNRDQTIVYSITLSVA